jgi:hypothetical protein
MVGEIIPKLLYRAFSTADKIMTCKSNGNMMPVIAGGK